jgi:regulator of RNase E activity RraA
MHRTAGSSSRLRRIHRYAKLVGNALTVRTRPGDNLMVHKAIDIAKPRDVIVVDAGGELAQAIIGEIMTTLAMTRGVAGFVIDGAVRDSGAIAAEDFPVYAAGVTHRGPYKDGPGEINVPVSVGGMVVHAGDILVGDEDGIVTVPLAEAEALLKVCAATREREDGTMREIRAGTVDRSWVDALLKTRGFAG